MRFPEGYRAAGLLLCFGALGWSQGKLGLFESTTGIGTLLKAGDAAHDGANETYTVTGSGENMWFAKDEFQYVWTKVTAPDVSLAADILLLGEGGDNHRKGVLMIRQSLDPDAAYADAAVHGDGLTSLQYRESQGEATHEIESSAAGPRRLQLQKVGDRFYLWIGDAAGPMTFAGGSTRIELKAPFYVGIGVCAHNRNALQKASFSHVELKLGKTTDARSRTSYSTLQTITVTSTDARVSHVSTDRLQTPSWTADGAALLFQAGANWQQVPVKGGSPETATAAKAGSDKTRLSPDGKQRAVLVGSTDPDDGGDVVLLVLNVADGSTKVLAKFQGGEGSLGAHPWSPDGKRLAFVSYQAVPSVEH